MRKAYDTSRARTNPTPKLYCQVVRLRVDAGAKIKIKIINRVTQEIVINSKRKIKLHFINGATQEIILNNEKTTKLHFINGVTQEL